MEGYYLMHLPFFFIPGAFLLTGLVRIVRHWNDGKETTKFHASRLFLKILACFFCAVLEIFHIVDLSPKKYYNNGEELIRTCYFLLSFLAWIFSSYIVYFKFKRRLKGRWIGLRGYWILSFFSNSGLLALNIFSNNLIVYNRPISNYYLTQTIIYSFSIFTCLVLSFYAIFHPNDFIVVKREKNEEFIPKEISVNEEGHLIKVSMAGFKIKDQGNINYDIIVSVNGVTHKVSRTYPEFDKLHKELLISYSTDPECRLPELPSFLQRNLTLEMKTSALGEYLKELCQQSCFISELLDFLKIEGKVKESILQNLHRPFETCNDTFPRSESALLGYFDPKPLVNDALTLSIPAYHLNWMIDIHIPTWNQTESHVEYFIKSEIRLFSFENITVSRYSEIYALHKHLKKQHIPIPHFPSKIFHQSLDIRSIEIRRSQLEEYLGALFNDPAYLTQYLLKFINCDVDISRILKLIPICSFKSELILPISWEGEIASDSTHYITYHMRFFKSGAGKEQEWEVSRRFREFDALHKVLIYRSTSVLLREYIKSELIPLPSLPNKSLSPLCTSEEIENRKKGLENYLLELLKNPAVTCSYYFRNFIGEIEYSV